MKVSARMFLSFAAFSVFAGILYASFTREYAGLFLFGMFAVADIFIAILLLKAGDPEEQKRIAQARGLHEAHGEIHLPPPSIWPFVISVGATVVAWGFLLQPWVIALGVVVLLAGVAGWAGGFRSVNRDLAAWGEVWRYRQYQNIDDIQRELDAMELDAMEQERQGRSPRP